MSKLEDRDRQFYLADVAKRVASTPPVANCDCGICVHARAVAAAIASLEPNEDERVSLPASGMVRVRKRKK